MFATGTDEQTHTVGGDETASATPLSACENADATESVHKAIVDLPVPRHANGESLNTTWNADSADLTNFDACSKLSWVILPTDPSMDTIWYTVLLFHYDESVGTAAALPHPSAPDVRRVSGSAIDVTWSWAAKQKSAPQSDAAELGSDDATAPGSDGTAANDAAAAPGPQNTATSRFTWDPAIGNVMREGDLPPFS